MQKARHRAGPNVNIFTVTLFDECLHPRPILDLGPHPKTRDGHIGGRLGTDSKPSGIIHVLCEQKGGTETYPDVS